MSEEDNIKDLESIQSILDDILDCDIIEWKVSLGVKELEVPLPNNLKRDLLSEEQLSILEEDLAWVFDVRKVKVVTISNKEKTIVLN